MPKAEIPENYRKVPKLRKIKEDTADIKYISYTTCRSYKHRGGSNNGTRHKIPQNKGKFPEPDKLENFREIRETGSLANDQCHKKWKIAKNSRKGTEEPVERVRTRYNEQIKQRRKMSPTQIKTSNEH